MPLGVELADSAAAAAVLPYTIPVHVIVGGSEEGGRVEFQQTANKACALTLKWKGGRGDHSAIPHVKTRRRQDYPYCCCSCSVGGHAHIYGAPQAHHTQGIYTDTAAAGVL